MEDERTRFRALSEVSIIDDGQLENNDYGLLTPACNRPLVVNTITIHIAFMGYLIQFLQFCRWCATGGAVDIY